MKANNLPITISFEPRLNFCTLSYAFCVMNFNFLISFIWNIKILITLNYALCIWHVCIEESEKKFNLWYFINDLDELIFTGFFEEQRTHLRNLGQCSRQWHACSPHLLGQCIHYSFQRYIYNAPKFSTAGEKWRNNHWRCLWNLLFK